MAEQLNIIEFLQDLLLQFPSISAVLNTVSIDFSDDSKESYGLSPIGDILIKEDILGNQTRQHNFILYAVYQSINDFDRLNNSGTILELHQWLERQANHNPIISVVGSETYSGEVTKITPSNGMLYQIPNDNFQDLVRYQLQIAVEYKINLT